MWLHHPLFHCASTSCWHPGGTELTRHGFERCRAPAHARVADIGCGGGGTVMWLRKQGYACVGVDIAPSPFSHMATNTVSTLKPGQPFPYICAQADALPFAAKTFDGFVCECVLSLLSQPHSALEAWFAACKTGGFLLLSDVYAKHALSHEATVATMNTCHKKSQCSTGLFTKHELNAALQHAGWQVEYFEDHSRALALFAAQLIWNDTTQTGNAAQQLATCTALRQTCSYGLWIARKTK